MKISLLIDGACCDDQPWAGEIVDTEVTAAAGGKELSKFVCLKCGGEYMLGVIARTAEESRAAEVFEELTPDQEEAAGIDRGDFEPSIEDAAMCVRCDGNVNRSADLCRGCREYVCASCRVRPPKHPSRHMAEEHWEEPVLPMGDERERATELDDDGSRIDRDSDDFISEV